MPAQEELMPLVEIIVQMEFINHCLNKYMLVPRLKVDRAELDKVIEIRQLFQKGDKLSFDVFAHMTVSGIYKE